MILRRGISLALLGLVLGLAGAMASRRLIIHLLYQTSPSDPMILTGISIVLIVSAALSAYLPARAATRIDPMVVLKKD